MAQQPLDEEPHRSREGWAYHWLSVAAYVATFASIAALAAWEASDWLRTASLPGRSLSTFWPINWRTGWSGVDVILHNLWTAWIGIPVFAVGTLVGWIFKAMVSDADERAGIKRTWWR